MSCLCVFFFYFKAKPFRVINYKYDDLICRDISKYLS